MTEQTPEESRISSLNPHERETTVNASDGDDTVRIWTAQRRYITRLRANPKATEVATGHYGSTEWAKFEIPADAWNPATGIKRNAAPMTEERKAQALEALARGRATQAE